MEVKKVLNIAKNLILAIDSGTTSSRVALIDKQLNILDIENSLHQQIHLNQGWTEHNPEEIMDNVNYLISKLKSRNVELFQNISGISITNQRETVLCWNKSTGKSYSNAIVWHDTRTHDIVNRMVEKYGNVDFLRKKCGLPMNTYFSAGKIRWIIENNEIVREKVKNNDINDLCFGTIDSWLIFVKIVHYIFRNSQETFILMLLMRQEQC